MTPEFIIVFLQSLATTYPIILTILTILGGLVVVGQTIVILTPSKADDAKWEAIKAKPIIGPVITALSEFAPIQKKPPKPGT